MAASASDVSSAALEDLDRRFPILRERRGLGALGLARLERTRARSRPPRQRRQLTRAQRLDLRLESRSAVFPRPAFAPKL